MDETVAVTLEDACTDYGSDVDVRSLPTLSDYGSELDPDDVDEDSLLGDLLVRIAATAPKDVVRPSIDCADPLESRDEGFVVPSTERPALQRGLQSSPARRKGESVEIEYDLPSRRAFSGMRQSLSLAFDGLAN